MNELIFDILVFLLIDLLAMISIIIAPILCKLIPDLCDIIRDFVSGITDDILFKIGTNNSRKNGRSFMKINNNCNLITCHYNKNGKCINKRKRIECVEYSLMILCVGDKK